LLLLLLLMMLGSTHPVGRGRWAPLFSRFFFQPFKRRKNNLIARPSFIPGAADVFWLPRPFGV
jgi:hypothetical protein